MFRWCLTADESREQVQLIQAKWVIPSRSKPLIRHVTSTIAMASQQTSSNIEFRCKYIVKRTSRASWIIWKIYIHTHTYLCFLYIYTYICININMCVCMYIYTHNYLDPFPSTRFWEHEYFFNERHMHVMSDVSYFHGLVSHQHHLLTSASNSTVCSVSWPMVPWWSMAAVKPSMAAWRAIGFGRFCPCHVQGPCMLAVVVVDPCLFSYFQCGMMLSHEI